MATGKTTVAKAIAQRLGRKYVSIDDMISDKTKKTVSQIFKEEGEETFRKMEIEVVKEVAGMRNVVIDCGGGVVVNKMNIERLKQDGFIILLKASPATIIERNLKNGRKRPLLEVEDQSKAVKELLARRAKLYETSADYEVDTTNLTVEQVVEKIVDILQKTGEHNEGYR